MNSYRKYPRSQPRAPCGETLSAISLPSANENAAAKRIDQGVEGVVRRLDGQRVGQAVQRVGPSGDEAAGACSTQVCPLGQPEICDERDRVRDGVCFCFESEKQPRVTRNGVNLVVGAGHVQPDLLEPLLDYFGQPGFTVPFLSPSADDFVLSGPR